MYETAHMQDGDELRRAVLRLEEAVVRQETRLAEAGATADDPPLQHLRRSVLLMRREAERLRGLLDAG